MKLLFLALSILLGSSSFEIDPPEIEPARPIGFVSLEAPEDVTAGYWSVTEVDSYDIAKKDIPDRTFVRLDSNFVFPYGVKVRSPFGYRNGRNHGGVDIPIPTGTQVAAAFGGTVRVATYHRGYGYIVIIRHSNGLETCYAHLSKLKVTSGEQVQAGDIIALSGSTGRSTGPHLHFEMLYCGHPFDPELIIDCESGTLLQSPFMLRREMLY